MRPVADPVVAEALDLVERGLEQLRSHGVNPADDRDARTLIRRTERIGRRMDAVKVSLLDAIDSEGLFSPDGHHSAKVMVRHVGRLSHQEAAARESTMRALRQMPSTAAAHARGSVGTCQVRRLGRAFANKRVRDRLVEHDGPFSTVARHETYRRFDEIITDWVRLADEDGTADRSQANHRNRRFRVHQEYDLGWRIEARCGSLDGAQFAEVHAAFVKAELMSDLAEARRRRGDDVMVTKEMLGRTDEQRSWDAMQEMARQATANSASGRRPVFTTNIVIDQVTFERELHRQCGVDIEPRDPWDPTFRCHTNDGGHRIDQREAFATTLAHAVKRVVIDATGVVQNVSRRTRLFTGNTRLAVQIAGRRCVWPGCHVPVGDCQVDHVTPWSTRADGSGGGETCPENGALLCGHHNRLKERGYTVHRDDEGELHVVRPDGVEVEARPPP